MVHCQCTVVAADSLRRLPWRAARDRQPAMMLVFGGHGQLGREIADAAAVTGRSVALIPRSEANVTSADDVARAISAHRPAAVVNAAAYTKVDDAESHAEEAFRVNEQGAATLARARKTGGLPLIHVSTDYVFDGSKAAPIGRTIPSRRLASMAARRPRAKSPWRPLPDAMPSCVRPGFTGSTARIFSRPSCGSQASATSLRSLPI